MAGHPVVERGARHVRVGARLLALQGPDASGSARADVAGIVGQMLQESLVSCGADTANDVEGRGQEIVLASSSKSRPGADHRHGDESGAIRRDRLPAHRGRS